MPKLTLGDNTRIPQAMPSRTYFMVPYTENKTFIGRESILKQLREHLLGPASQARIALFGLGGIGLVLLASI